MIQCATENISYLIFVHHGERVFMSGDNVLTVFANICKEKTNKCQAKLY